jgi:predicted DNA-binding transcriptional regulator AlpA
MSLSPNRGERRRLEALRARGFTKAEIDEIPPRHKTPKPVVGNPYFDIHGVLQHFGGVSDVTMWRWEKKLGFPKPDLIVNRRRFWRLSTLESWVPVPKEAATAQQETASRKLLSRAGHDARPIPQ